MINDCWCLHTWVLWTLKTIKSIFHPFLPMLAVFSDVRLGVYSRFHHDEWHVCFLPSTFSCLDARRGFSCQNTQTFCLSHVYITNAFDFGFWSSLSQPDVKILNLIFFFRKPFAFWVFKLLRSHSDARLLPKQTEIIVERLWMSKPQDLNQLFEGIFRRFGKLLPLY